MIFEATSCPDQTKAAREKLQKLSRSCCNFLSPCFSSRRVNKYSGIFLLWIATHVNINIGADFNRMFLIPPSSMNILSSQATKPSTTFWACTKNHWQKVVHSTNEQKRFFVLLCCVIFCKLSYVLGRILMFTKRTRTSSFTNF